MANLSSLFSRDMVDEMDEDEIKHLANESTETANDRERCSSKLKVLEAGMSGLKKLDRGGGIAHYGEYQQSSTPDKTPDFISCPACFLECQAAHCTTLGATFNGSKCKGLTSIRGIPNGGTQRDALCDDSPSTQSSGYSSPQAGESDLLEPQEISLEAEEPVPVADNESFYLPSHYP